LHVLLRPIENACDHTISEDSPPRGNGELSTYTSPVLAQKSSPRLGKQLESSSSGIPPLPESLRSLMSTSISTISLTA
jgi:hypothetical protein